MGSKIKRMAIEIYRTSKSHTSPSFDHQVVCRECAIQKVEEGYYVELDGYATKYVRDFTGSECEVCGTGIRAVRTIKEIDGAIY